MGPIVDSIETDEKLPEAVDVAIIGGGIVGVSTALALAEKGVSTALLEKGHIACEQSSRNWGWVRAAGRDLRELPLMAESLRLWRCLDEMTGGETGFRESGSLYIADDVERAERLERWADHAGRRQIGSRLIRGRDLQERLPGAARPYRAALYTPGDGYAEPQKAAPAIAAAARQKGVLVFQNCAVRGIEREVGKIAAVVTEKGRLRCQAVVVASGVWSRLLTSGLGLSLPQLKLLASVLRTEPFDSDIALPVSAPGVSLRKRLDGGYTVATSGTTIAEITPDSFRFLRSYLPAYLAERKSLRLRFGARFFEEALHWRLRPLNQVSIFEQRRVLDPAPDEAILERVMQNLVREFPAFEKAKVAQKWGGLIDSMPDAIPVISAVEEVPGAYVATGFSGHGFGIGPGAGRLVADMVTGDPTLVDPAPFRLSRLFESRRLELQTWL